MAGRALALLTLPLLAAWPGTNLAADGALRRRLARENPGQVAEDLLRRAQAQTQQAHVWVALAEAQSYRCDLGAARHALAQALRRDPFHASARAALAESLLLESRAAEALAEVQRGLAAPTGSSCAELWRVRCLTLVELRRYPEALEAGRRAVALAPEHARAAEALGRAAFQAGDMATARDAYTTAADLDLYAEEAELRLGNGFGLNLEGRPWEQGEQGAAFWSARLAWEAGALDEARDRFAALVRAHPHVFKYRLGLGSVLAARRRAHEARQGTDARALYALLPAPSLTGLETVLPDYGRLASYEQHAVRVALAPLKPWWPALKTAGARHDFLPLAENLGDRTVRNELRGRLTFDGRWYDQLRGVGGRHAATGTEKLSESAELGFHTFAHELAHQVLSFAFTDDLRTRIKVLFARATLEGRCLDYYAASNVDEYFAQAYEAFVSHLKRGCLKETQRHVRAELLERDPALHALFLEVFDVSHETPASLAPFLAAAARAGPPPPPPTR